MTFCRSNALALLATALVGQANARADGEAPAPPPIITGGIVAPLYPKDSPHLDAARVQQAETYNMTKGVPGRIQSVVNIHNPSVEFHPADPAWNTGAVVILAAGGAHRTLNVGTEGGDLVPFFYNYGVSTVILRNRLRGDGYDVRKHAVRDTLQAIRLVRSRARAWGVDDKRIGIMGFSAGAELAAAAALFFAEADGTSDPLAGISARPDFVALLYPGPSPFSREPDTAIPRDAPPAFVATAGTGDRGHALWAIDFVAAYLKQGIPNVELHIYGHGVHANGLKDRAGTPFGTWQLRFVEWFRDLGYLQKPGVETKAARDTAAWVPPTPRARTPPKFYTAPR